MNEEVWADSHAPSGLIESSLIKSAGHRAAYVLGERDFIQGSNFHEGSIKREDDQVSVMLTLPYSPKGEALRFYDELVHVRFIFDSESLRKIIGVMGVKTEWRKNEREIERVSLLPFDESQADRKFSAFGVYRNVKKAAFTARYFETQSY